MKNKNFIFAKFAIVAVAIGFLSPSISIQESRQYNSHNILDAQINISFMNKAEARRGRGGGANRNRSANRNRNSNRNRNTNVNRNVNKNVNVNVNHRNGGRYYGGGSYRGGAIAAGVVTGLVIGSIVASVPPSCNTVRVNNVEYRNCSGTYYQPYYQGSTVSYRVVNSPY